MGTTLAERFRRALVAPENPASASARARAKRWNEFLSRFPGLGDMRVLDLGGLPGFWTRSTTRPASVTTVNLYEAPNDTDWITHRVIDACSADQVLGDGSTYDLVVSNSLLEHVGGYDRRCRLAEVVHGAADRHWVQTPNRYFPIEPHFLAPGWQFLPVPARAAVLRAWTICPVRPRDYAEALHVVLSTELVTTAELRLLFPDSDVWFERTAGIVKSMVAIKDR